MSLSSEPALSALKEYFVCGVRDITGQSYAGVSGQHDKNGNAVNTSNGAGPHNVQLFMLSQDGVVLNCLPGYWSAGDLVREMKLARNLNDVWMDASLNRGQKENLFRQMQLAHIGEHPRAMSMRSRMQGFDQKYEAKYHLYDSDTITDPNLITDVNAMMLPQSAFKTVDRLMHERLSKQPFIPYFSFNVASFVDYGRPLYDKHEDEQEATAHLSESRSRANRQKQARLPQNVNPARYVQYYGR